MKIEITRKADVDLTEIWVWNAERYGIEHADKYHEFLHDELQRLWEHPESGRLVQDFPQLRCFVIRRRPSGHGHAAYYELNGETVSIKRILHTSMNAPDHLSED